MPLYVKWVNDFEVTRGIDLGTLPPIRPITLEAEEAWYESTIKDERNFSFAIYETSTMRPIGNTALMDVDLVHRTAEFGILIGEKDCWGKGYASDAVWTVINELFTQPEIQRIVAETRADNAAAIRLFEHCGFRTAERVTRRGPDGEHTWLQLELTRAEYLGQTE